MSLRLSAILDADDDRAARATCRLLEPALRRRVRAIVRRALPGACACQDGRVCHICQAIIDDIILAAHSKLRDAARGQLPYTRATQERPGEEVREWRLLVDGLTEPAETASLDADVAGSMLATYKPSRSGPSRQAGQATPPGQAWLRAAWWQLIHYRIKNLEIDLRRSAAVERGLPARPMRSLDSSPAALPLAGDPPADSALREFVIGLWANVSHPYDLPATEQRHGLSPDAARAALDRGLGLLCAHDPALYRTLVTGPLAARAPGSADRGETAQVAAEAAKITADFAIETDPDTDHARSALLAEIASETAPDIPNAPLPTPQQTPTPTQAQAQASRRGTRPGAARGRRQPDQRVALRLLRSLLNAADGRAVDPVGHCRRLRGVDEPAAQEEIRHLATLVAAAGVMWVDDLVQRLENGQPPA
ncbi:hypothetical protein [Frankia sp. Cas3]|uniref:hypothetical protein n=1 Tax=Frankia sp. Cas3 TaxID=3073926 RepID=UPI002AD2ADA4|nr:hypothetical protein [Frankia sp. Cas3]